MTSIKFRALTHNEQKLFFAALGEYGKDFQNIQQYISQKCSKLNSKSSDTPKATLQYLDPQEKRDADKKEEDKKREQIRNFYNKLYAKLSLLIGKLDDRVEKVNQELYLLINYGEIWKKYGFKYNNNKTKKLLEELVYHGYTVVRFKNKNIRLRTPPCKALKKINKIGVDEEVKVVTSRELPKDVIVEFHPGSNRDWLKVQAISQNPRVRAKLSMQKRLFNIIEFLENKWNISQEKLNRTVDTWLKVPSTSQQAQDDLNIQPPNNLNTSENLTNLSTNEGSSIGTTNKGLPQTAQTTNDTLARLRLKPSSVHELKEVNITRVVPDNHLDLSLNAYINRLTESGIKSVNRDQPTANNSTGSHDMQTKAEGLDISQGAFSNNSRLPLSLTTPDSSIIFERSMTSDQPSIAQARKHLNILQSLAGSFDGGENSRIACDDTQDKSPANSFLIELVKNRQSQGLNEEPSIQVSRQASSTTIIPELFDENATIGATIPKSELEHAPAASLTNCDQNSQNSRSLDFPRIPKNLTLGDWFKMNGQESACDDAGDSFPIEQTSIEGGNNIDEVDTDREKSAELKRIKKDVDNNCFKPQSHMIEIQKFADGWTRQDECPLTIGELYLAFKCPEKVLLEYSFEQFTVTQQDSVSDDLACKKRADGSNLDLTAATALSPPETSGCSLIFKLLTAASLSLAQIDRQKQEQQHKLHDQPGAKFKRRKGPSNPNTIKFLKSDSNFTVGQYITAVNGDQQERDPNTGQLFNRISAQSSNSVSSNSYVNGHSDKQGQLQAMTPLDIETTNQRVEEALKQLQPTRLGVFRRAR